MMFLYRATTNRCLNQLRNQRNRLRLIETKHAPAASPEASDAGAEARAVVVDALRELPDDIAQAVVYYYVDEMTHAEIATLMDCSRRHVGNLLARFSREHTQKEAPC